MTAEHGGHGAAASTARWPHSPLGQDYLEIMPIKGVAEKLVHVPAGSWIGISCSPAAGVGPTLELVDTVNALYPARGFRLAPHVAARVIRDRAHLADVIARLREAKVPAIFVPGGDSKTPAGRYGCALDLLRDMAELDHPFRHVGVAAHPEGLPMLSRKEALRVLLDKQAYATYLVTQMCFDAARITCWLSEIRQAGVALHAWLGLPGVMETRKLLAVSLRIGVGRSVAMLKKHRGLASGLLGGLSYRPDTLFEGLRPAMGNPELGVYGCHLFSFNNVEATERWRNEMLQKLAETEHPDS